MHINNYTEEVQKSIDKIYKFEQKDQSANLYLSLIDEMIPLSSLVVLGGRPRTGKTSLILNFIAQNSLKQTDPTDKNTLRKGLVYFIGHKEELVLRRWYSIVTKMENLNGDEAQYIYDMGRLYAELMRDAVIDFTFMKDISELENQIDRDIEVLNPDYVIVDNHDFAAAIDEFDSTTYKNDSEIINKMITLQKTTNKMVLISVLLGLDAWKRGEPFKHCLEDFSSKEIEKNADIVLTLYRPELYGLVSDEEGHSLKGVIEVQRIINRYGNELDSFYWHNIHGVPRRGKNMEKLYFF